MLLAPSHGSVGQSTRSVSITVQRCNGSGIMLSSLHYASNNMSHCGTSKVTGIKGFSRKQLCQVYQLY